MENLTKFIIIEGSDGSGKSTMTKTLKEYIDNNIERYTAEIVAYPHKGYFGYDKIREILSGKITAPPDIVQSLFIMNMIDSFENYINPYFNTNGKVIIMDRSIISTIVYNKLANGNILESIIKYLYKDEYLHLLSIDTINQKYCNMKGNIDNIFFLSPPLEIVLQHSKNRLLENKKIDDNDKIECVIKQYKNYIDLYESFAKLNNNMTILNIWDYKLSEQENYLNLQNIIISTIFN